MFLIKLNIPTLFVPYVAPCLTKSRYVVKDEQPTKHNITIIWGLE
jgi:hypothetical protein